VEDIKEFGSTIKNDTSVALEAVTAQATPATPSTPSSSHTGDSVTLATLSDGFSSFVSGMSDLAQGVAKELNEVRLSTSSPSSSHDVSSPSISMTELQEKLNSSEEKQFADWLGTFEMESRRAEISELLAANASVLALHQQLVPSELSSEEFWGRYFYKTGASLQNGIQGIAGRLVLGR